MSVNKPKPKLSNIELYKQIKQDYRNTIVLFKVGDFWETYNKDADILHKVLGLKIHVRTNDRLTGFPNHILGEHVQQLKKNGYEYILIEPKNNESISLTKKQENNMETNKGIKFSAFKCICPNEYLKKSYYWFNSESRAL